MNSENFHFEKGLNYKIFHIVNPTRKHDPFMVSFPCIFYVKSGWARVSYNTEPYSIKQNDIFCIFPNKALKSIEISDDFNASAILFSPDVFIDSTIGFNAEYMTGIFRVPRKTLTDANVTQIFTNLFNTLDTYAEMSEKYERSSDFVYGIIRCMLISLAEMSKLNEKFMTGTTYSTTDNYFREFIKLLSEHCKTQHNVAFYADKLCITPKYLNEICRKKTKHTAKEVITRSVIAQIKSALIVSGTSVQRIAYDFNFCDQSSFGKYFKKAVGLAPMAFRNKHLENPEIYDMD